MASICAADGTKQGPRHSATRSSAVRWRRISNDADFGWRPDIQAADAAGHRNWRGSQCSGQLTLCPCLPSPSTIRPLGVELVRGLNPPRQRVPNTPQAALLELFSGRAQGWCHHQRDHLGGSAYSHLHDWGRGRSLGTICLHPASACTNPARVSRGSVTPSETFGTPAPLEQFTRQTPQTWLGPGFH